MTYIAHYKRERDDVGLLHPKRTYFENSRFEILFPSSTLRFFIGDTNLPF
jgi:hypothetical protein